MRTRRKCLHSITVRLEWRHYTTPADKLPGLIGGKNIVSVPRHDGFLVDMVNDGF